MKNFLRNHPDTTLIVLMGIFLAVIAGFYVWGVSDVAMTVNSSLNYAAPQQDQAFDLPSAAKLDWRGLVK